MTIIVRNLSDQLVSLLRDRILSGQVNNDLPIRQDALAAELGVSKIPLREALARLEEEGLVASQANRGFYVRPMTTEEAEEVYALRIRLEPDAMMRAAERASKEERKHAIDLAERMDEIQKEHGEGVGAFNRRFHHALYAPSRQPVTVNILDRLQVLSERYVRKHLEPLGRDERANEEHRGLLAAWLACDTETLRELARAHTAKTLDDLRNQFNQLEGAN
ncbi:MAG: GntR family transcriptional regulator [Pseudomonadota bacterium]